MRSEPRIEELFEAISNYFEDIKTIVESNNSDNKISNFIIILRESENISELSLKEIILYIDDEIIPILNGYQRFYAFVAKNSLKIALRQMQLIDNYDELEKIRLNKILNFDGDLEFLNKELCKKIKNKEIERNDPKLKDHLIRSTMAKLSVDQPNYSGYLKALEDQYPSD